MLFQFGVALTQTTNCLKMHDTAVSKPNFTVADDEVTKMIL